MYSRKIKHRKTPGVHIKEKGKKMDRERFEKQLNFILEIDKEKQILRQTHIRGYSRQEDDAEHAWHMADGISAAGIFE